MQHYQQVLEYLYSQLPMYHRVGAAAYKANLDNTLALDTLLGHPHTRFKTIHVAGTNGKGSVSHMMAAVLACAGYRTGLYTSPHLKDFRERIRINGAMISEEAVVNFVDRHRQDFERLQPSFFEMTVALAFDYFASENVDIAVIEVGLGGRLDSTNIITPLLSVITSIGLDHTNLLGDTLEKIAAEKAGIIKQGVPVIIGETHPATEKVFRQKAAETDAPIVFADRQLKRLTLDNGVASNPDKQNDSSQAYRLGLSGGYQLKNLRSVLLAVEHLRASGFTIPKAAVQQGLAEVTHLTGLRGRWEKISDRPLTYCDVGHNEDGIREVMAMVHSTPHDKLHMVIGVVNDKDANAILRLMPGDAAYYFCKASIPRALPEDVLQITAKAHHLHGEAFPDVPSALAAARRNAGPDDLIFIGGSTFTVADAL